MKKTLIVASILGAVSAMSSTSAMAVDGLSANAAVTSNYFWRGMTQTADAAAVSGGIDYAAESGFYAGTWVSNLANDTETDLYLGFSGETDSVSYDVGYVYYNYANPGQELDFGEIYGSVTFGALTLGLAVLANEEAGDFDFGDSTYVSADYAVEVAPGLEAAFHIGSYDGDFAVEGVDIGASLSKDGFTFGIIESDRDGQNLEAYVSYAVDFDL
ncbi:TorF family putative porin [Catenovulum adriaticum]|uniref:TorF family putative porin n=1 Tax=Catenovulum adriaticum TaxID=2984846 RepID=A0ABY7AM23_9ALTE|nr:TorF family putative porin [Catenovulum sp. TS8]WAJ70268.1 TorF family putative porin [Catenovulum sp. TS8]